MDTQTEISGVSPHKLMGIVGSNEMSDSDIIGGNGDSETMIVEKGMCVVPCDEIRHRILSHNTFVESDTDQMETTPPDVEAPQTPPSPPSHHIVANIPQSDSTENLNADELESRSEATFR